MSSSTFLTFLFWQGFGASTALAQKCYLPSEDEAPGDTPCNSASSNQASACCNPSDACLSNGLCLKADLTVNRGSCTDRTWKSAGCAPWCQDVWPSSGVGLFNVKDQLFCCGSNSFNYSDDTCYNVTQGSNAPFPVEQGRVIFNRTSGSTLPDDTPDDTTATFTKTITLAGSTIHSVTTSAVAAAVTAASPPPTVHGEATVGIAVGVSLGVALLVSVGMLWRQRREATRLRAKKRDWKKKFIALLESKTETQKGENVPQHTSEKLVRYQLDDAKIGEMPS